MGRKRKHGQQFQRKRKSIDLNALSKKKRLEYRKRKPLQNKQRPKEEPEDEDTEESSSSENEIDVHEVSSDDEANPYQQLVATLSDKVNTHKDSDEDDEEEDSEVEQNSEDNSDVEDENHLINNVTAEDLSNEDQESDENEEDEDGSDVSDENEEAENNDSEVEGAGEEGEQIASADPFVQHFETDLDENVAEELGSNPVGQTEEAKVTGLGTGVFQWNHDAARPKPLQKADGRGNNLHVRQVLYNNVSTINSKKDNSSSLNCHGFTSLQQGLFSMVNNYQDILYTDRNSTNGEEIRLTYCLHALNHVLKTRKRVIAHNTKIKQRTQTATDEDFRDQGLTRPKVLMILPFRESAKKCVDMFIQLLNPTDKSFVDNKKRFYDEYGLEAEEESTKKGLKPEDFDVTFAGNIDDHFRIGIGVAKKTLKLYTKFYNADIILASPLGLRTLVGAEGEKERDYDFLNSIEVLVIDQADVLMMQNWDHVVHIMKHMHLQPQESHGVDFSRVRMWTLNGWSKYYRQNLVFTAVPVPEVTSLVKKHCHNYAGIYQFIKKPTAGSICQITFQLPQVFHRIDCTNFASAADDRFSFFVDKIFSKLSEASMSQLMIFVPSYFDFVRVRNHFQREKINFLQICEYSKGKTTNTARNLFYNRKVNYLLYTERYHFYHRIRIRGIRHIVFYGLPQYSGFYSEMCNMLNDVKNKGRSADHMCTVLYTKYDAMRLAEVVGADRAAQMLHSKKSVHMFVSGENG